MKDLLEHLRPYRDALTHEMRSVAERFLPGPSAFDRMLRYHLGWVDDAGNAVDIYPGKQIRPILLLLCTEAAGGNWQQALPAAAAIELLHNFSLIHDDIEDASPLRRGRPAIWKLWGTANAINAGDAMFALAYAALWRLAEVGVPDSRVLRVLFLFTQANLTLTRGQHLDMAFEAMPVVSLDEYLAMIGDKSASLISLSTQLGAIIAGAGDDAAQRYADFGYNLGLAFQIRDDILGIWGDPATTGKSAVTDIASRKKTLPVLYGLGVSQELNELYAQPELSDGDVMRCMRILETCGAREFAAQYEDRYFQAVIQGFEGMNVAAGPSMELLRSLVSSLLGRSF